MSLLEVSLVILQRIENSLDINEAELGQGLLPKSLHDLSTLRRVLEWSVSAKLRE